MHRLAAAALALAAAAAAVHPAIASAEEDPAYEKAKSGAVPPEGGLSTFLARFVGACTEESGPQCKKAAEEYRQKHKGKKLSLTVEDASRMVAVGSKGDGGEVVLNVTPFFPGGELALTAGAPSRTDGAGNPVLPLMRVDGKAPDGDADRLARMLSMHQVKVEVVFSPEGTWSLPKKGGGAIQGVKAKLLAMRIAMARTDETVAIWTR